MELIKQVERNLRRFGNANYGNHKLISRKKLAINTISPSGSLQKIMNHTCSDSYIASYEVDSDSVLICPTMPEGECLNGEYDVMSLPEAAFTVDHAVLITGETSESTIAVRLKPGKYMPVHIYRSTNTTVNESVLLLVRCDT
ncbi:hypothetical protein [Enterovibrio norvegicus]|uniref:hypothetical protein n=1 Tax=Enterovibrio norvegicus TaxID=188144 RepID=UPI00352F6329